jgi:hypothetical protein
MTILRISRTAGVPTVVLHAPWTVNHWHIRYKDHRAKEKLNIAKEVGIGVQK